jgi:Kef-type K+ transport system membrane component KefB
LASAGERPVFAFFLGIALCVSAIPVIAKTLLDMNLMHRDVGQLVLTAAAMSDLIGWVLLSIVATIATVGWSVFAGLTAIVKIMIALTFFTLFGHAAVEK